MGDFFRIHVILKILIFFGNFSRFLNARNFVQNQLIFLILLQIKALFFYFNRFFL